MTFQICDYGTELGGMCGVADSASEGTPEISESSDSEVQKWRPQVRVCPARL